MLHKATFEHRAPEVPLRDQRHVQLRGGSLLLGGTLGYWVQTLELGISYGDTPIAENGDFMGFYGDFNGINGTYPLVMSTVCY